MRVTKSQVERLADARREYEYARRDIAGPGKPVKYVGEPARTLDELRAMADAAGVRVEREPAGTYTVHRFELRGVEFYRIEQDKGGEA